VAQLDRAEELYREAIDRGADGAAPWLGLATLLDERDAASEAIEVLGRGVLHEDRNLELRKVLVSSLLEQGRPDEALVRLQALLARWPDDPDALHNMTILLARGGRLPEAVAHAERLVAVAPGDPRGYNDLGILLARLGRTEEAAAVFRRGLEAVPGNEELRRNLATLAGD
jgi:Flp pilus assembly protein TadD